MATLLQPINQLETAAAPAVIAAKEVHKYYDLGEGFCTYDFFARCPHRLACARCPFYLPKESGKGQLLAVKEGIGRMLERVDLTDEERAVLEGDREVLTSLAERLADVPTPALGRMITNA